MKTKYYIGRARVPRWLFDYACTEKPTGLACDLLAWLCCHIGSCFLVLARWHFETGLRLAGGSNLLRHLEHDE